MKGRDNRISKEEQLWREMFPPQMGDLIKFQCQWKNKHRHCLGYIKRKFEDKRGNPVYLVQIIRIKPPCRNAYHNPPFFLKVKGNAKIKKIEGVMKSKR